MDPRFNGVVRSVLLASRWAMAPFCLGLIAALVIVLVQFCRELVHAAIGFAGMGGADVILAVLKLIDLMLVANLVLMLIEAAVEIFLPVEAADREPPGRARPNGAGTAEFAALKPKLFASISAIAAIDLLESFVNIDTMEKAGIGWEILILLTFVAAGVLLAWMDRIAAGRD